MPFLPVFSLSGLFYWLVEIYGWMIFAYALLSWFARTGPLFEVYRWLGLVCEPYIGLFRRILPMPGTGGVSFDLSPLVAWLVLQFLVAPVGSAILRAVNL